METKILTTLQFELTAVTAVTFLKRFVKLLSLDQNVLLLASFILELSLLDYFFMDARPSIVAVGALSVALFQHDHPVVVSRCVPPRCA